MSKYRILANDGIDAAGKARLEEAGIAVDTNKVSQDQLAEALKNFDGITVRSATKVRKDLIDALPNLKVIGRAGVGMDNIDVEHARGKGIRIINTPAASSISVAEIVFAHLSGLIRQLHLSNRIMPEQGNTRFNDIKKDTSAGIELKGKSIGIIGFGRIGQEVAKIAFGMGMEVYAYDPFVESIEVVLYLGQTAGNQRIKIPVKTISKEEVLKKSDFVTLHVPFNEGDKPVIGSGEIALMKKGSYIVNCARGGALDEKALLSAMESGHIAGAGLDVFEGEPIPSAEILKHPKISLSAHVGASTAEAQERIGLELADKIIDFLIKGN